MVLVRKDARVDLLPELKESLLTATSPEIHQGCKTSPAMDDKNISEKISDDQKRKTLVVGWWWMKNKWEGQT